MTRLVSRLNLVCLMSSSLRSASLFNRLLVFSWRTTLSANLFHNSPRLDVPSLYADYSFTLLTYGFALSNLAYSIVTSVGIYEHDRAISDADRKSKDEKLNVAVDFLCRASGIFTYISDTVLPEWETSRGNSPGFAKPPDITREITSALAKYVGKPTMHLMPL